jgi:glycerol-3-phosphate dehydrogenase (NAD(P)+)
VPVKAVVLGAGAWGTALAITLARAGHGVTLCPRRPEHCAELAREHENRTYLPGAKLPDQLSLTADWRAALDGAAIVVMAIPSQFARASLAALAEPISRSAAIVSVTKGIEDETLLTMTALISELAGRKSGIAALSGPGFAAEIARGKPAALVVAAHDEDFAASVRDRFAARPLRIYSSNDVAGVEIGGSVKNVIAIAAGISDGLELGSSARAGLITRGLAEMTRLAMAAGARRETLSGLAGLGDMILTCCGDLSRNRALGLSIGRRQPPTPDTIGCAVAEGVANARTVSALAARLKVEMPIVNAVRRILYEAAPVNAIVDELLSRQLKAEF